MIVDIMDTRIGRVFEPIIPPTINNKNELKMEFGKFEMYFPAIWRERISFREHTHSTSKHLLFSASDESAKTGG